MIFIRSARWPRKDRTIRKFYTQYEIRKTVIKSLIMNPNYSFSDKLYFNNTFQRFPIFSSISRYRNSCTISGYSRVVFRRFKLSRHFAKSYGSQGYLTGFRKSSF